MEDKLSIIKFQIRELERCLKEHNEQAITNTNGAHNSYYKELIEGSLLDRYREYLEYIECEEKNAGVSS